MTTVNLNEKFGQLNTHRYYPLIANYNDNDIIAIKFQGEFPFHLHQDTDDFFFIADGVMTLDLDSVSHAVKSRKLFVVPKGVTHQPSTDKECRVLLIKPKGEPNTGDSKTAAPKPSISKFQELFH